MATPLVTCSCASHASASTASFPRCWSRICQGLDDPVQVFWNRPLAFNGYPYLCLDATYLHSWDGARKQEISKSVIVAVGITATGQRDVLA